MLNSHYRSSCKTALMAYQLTLTETISTKKFQKLWKGKEFWGKWTDQRLKKLNVNLFFFSQHMGPNITFLSLVGKPL